MMTIYAIFLCSLATAPANIRPNVCAMPPGGPFYYATLNECQRVVDKQHPAEGFRFACMKHEIPVWEPATR